MGAIKSDLLMMLVCLWQTRPFLTVGCWVSAEVKLFVIYVLEEAGKKMCSNFAKQKYCRKAKAHAKRHTFNEQQEEHNLLKYFRLYACKVLCTGLHLERNLNHWVTCRRNLPPDPTWQAFQGITLPVCSCRGQSGATEVKLEHYVYFMTVFYQIDEKRLNEIQLFNCMIFLSVWKRLHRENFFVSQRATVSLKMDALLLKKYGQGVPPHIKSTMHNNGKKGQNTAGGSGGGV